MYLLDQNCLHLILKPYLSSETYFCKYEKLPNIVVHVCKILQKIVFVENIWPANLWWCSGNASALGARGPGFNPRIRQ